MFLKQLLTSLQNINLHQHSHNVLFFVANFLRMATGISQFVPPVKTLPLLVFVLCGSSSSKQTKPQLFGRPLSLRSPSDVPLILCVAEWTPAQIFHDGAL